MRMTVGGRALADTDSTGRSKTVVAPSTAQLAAKGRPVSWMSIRVRTVMEAVVTA